MSSPSGDQTQRPDDPLSYAPKWVRDPSSPERRPVVRKVYDRDLAAGSAPAASRPPVEKSSSGRRAYNPLAGGEDPGAAAVNMLAEEIRNATRRNHDGSRGQQQTMAGGEPPDDGLFVDQFRVPRSLDPNVISDPWETPRLGERSPLGMLGRFVLAAVVAAIAALVMVGKLPIGFGSSDQTSETDVASTSSVAPSTPAENAVESSPAVTQEQPSTNVAALQPPVVNPAPPPPPPIELVVQPGNVAAPDQPSPLGVSLVGPGEGSSLVVTGLPLGASLTSGRPLGGGAWRVAALDIGNIGVRPPRGYAGGMQLGLELRRADDSVADRQPVRLEWSAPPPRQAPPVVALAPSAEPIRQAPPLAPPAPARVAPPPVTAAPAAPSRAASRMDRDEIALLIKRGTDFMATGDIATARLVLRRAAEANDPRAALALAATYDPIVLERLGVRGFQPDVAMARSWYEKAQELGSPEAGRQLEALASRAR